MAPQLQPGHGDALGRQHFSQRLKMAGVTGNAVEAEDHRLNGHGRFGRPQMGVQDLTVGSKGAQSERFRDHIG